MFVTAMGSFLVLLVVAYLIAAPILVPDREDDSSVPSDLETRKDRLLSDIRELDMDLAMGKLDDEDHRRLRATTVAETAETLRAIDEAEAVSSAAIADGRADEDDDLERLIAERLAELEGRACPTCGTVCDQDDAFCRGCGASLETIGAR